MAVPVKNCPKTPHVRGLYFTQPGSGALVLVFLFGFYAILAGLSQIGLGWRLHGLTETAQTRTQRAHSVSR